MMTCGDDVSNVNLNELFAFHKSRKGMVTLTVVRPPARFGAIEFEGHQIRHFKEKSTLHEGWINGGFFGKWLLESFIWANDQPKLNAQMVVLRRPNSFKIRYFHLGNASCITFHQGDVRNFVFRMDDLILSFMPRQMPTPS
jgi:hypothetical protein